MDSVVATRLWLLTAHLLGVIFWLGGLFAVFWLLRIHAHAPKDAHEKLTLMERSLALMMDIAAAVAIGCGIAMTVWPVNMLAMKGAGWLHTKLAVVVLMILPVHGIVRGRVAQYARGQIKPLPQWMWSLLLIGITIAVIAAVTKFATFS